MRAADLQEEDQDMEAYGSISDDDDTDGIDSLSDASSFVSPRASTHGSTSSFGASSVSSTVVAGATGRLTSDVYMFIEAKDVYPTPRKQTKCVVWACKSCAAHDKVHEWQSRSTSNFRSHLRSRHSDEYVSSVDTGSQATTVAKHSSSSWTPIDQEEATKALVEWVTSHAQPLRVVEETTFRAFCYRLRPEYIVPSRPTIRSRLLTAWRDAKTRVRCTIKQELKGRRFGATTDMWTSVAKRGYMVVTMHYITDDWRVRSVMVGFVRVLSPHSGVRLSSHFIKSFEDMDAELLASLWSVTCDNASNNDVMASELTATIPAALESNQALAVRPPAHEIVRIRCMAHVLQLAVKEGLNKSPIIRSAIAIIRQTVKKIGDSPKLLEKLKECCARAKITDLEPVLDVDTRWNSTWFMIDCALKLRAAIDDLLRRIRQRHDGYTDLSIAPNDRLAGPISFRAWAVAKQYRHFLLPFKDATTLLSSASYPTLGMIAPIYWVTKRHVGDAAIDAGDTEERQSDDIRDPQSWDDDTSEEELTDDYDNDADAERDAATDPSFVAFAHAVMKKMKTYEHCITTKEAQIAAAVDPRIKSLVTTFGMDVHAVKRLIIEEFNSNYRAQYEAIQREQGVNAAQGRGGDATGHDEDLSTLRSLLDTEVLADNFGVHGEPFWAELDKWFSSRDGLKCGAKSSAVCEWYKLHGSMYPRIQMIARDFLALPATSVASEFAFSKAGCTIRDHRARLGDDCIRAILELQSFSGFLRQSDSQ